jgi:hypothetical protein
MPFAADWFDVGPAACWPHSGDRVRESYVCKQAWQQRSLMLFGKQGVHRRGCVFDNHNTDAELDRPIYLFGYMNLHKRNL